MATVSDQYPSINRPPLSNAEIAQKLMGLSNYLADQGASPFKVKAYRRAARTIQTLGDSFDELVRADADLTKYPGIGQSIGGVIQEIVRTGNLKRVAEHPLIEDKRGRRIFKKLNISSISELRERLKSGELAARMGLRTEQYVRQELGETTDLLLYDADRIAAAVEDFLLHKCPVVRVQATGAYRRRVEVVSDISFLIETGDFPMVVSRLESYGGRSTLLNASEDAAAFRLPSGAVVRVETATSERWGTALIAATGSPHHLRDLKARGCQPGQVTNSSYPNEVDVYRAFGMEFVEPELREGRGEVDMAAHGRLPALVSPDDIRGELHAHSTSSDGRNTIEQMAAAARMRGYEYIGISDHSQSLKIAGGLSEQELREQIHVIDKLNESLDGIRILKSAEVDILADGSLDYPDELLAELDYTVCSIHSRFALRKAEQTSRILRAMDNRYFTILGHATGRLLLKRPGYEIDTARVIQHAGKTGCFLEINSSPDRLDLSAENARIAGEAGVKIAINTDAHAIRDLDLIKYGIGQARRAGLSRGPILNCLSWPELRRTIKR